MSRDSLSRPGLTGNRRNVRLSRKRFWKHPSRRSSHSRIWTRVNHQALFAFEWRQL